MKRTKLLLAGTIAATMMLQMAPVQLQFANSVIVANAEETTSGTITITNAKEGETYSAYRILNYEAVTDTTGVYTVNDIWKAFIESSEYFTVDSNGYVTSTLTDDTVKTFAKEVISYAKENNITADASVTATADGTVTLDATYGYYVLDSSVGTVCMVTTTNPNAEVAEKNDVPTIDKTVKEDSSKEYGDANDDEIGEKVYYTLNLNAKVGAENYCAHDTMTEGLTFNNDVIVTLNGEEVPSGYYNVYTNGQSYTDSYGEEHTVTETFVVMFTSEFEESVTEDATYVISYTATINENAVIAGDGNTNTVELTYSHNGKTEQDITTTYVYKFNLHKYAQGDENTNLAGAKFVLFRGTATYDSSLTAKENVEANAANEIKLVKEESGEYRVATAEEIESGETVDYIETTSTGDVVINGLDADTYSMIEIEAPSGYNLLGSVVNVQISNNDSIGTYKVEGTTDNLTVKVANSTGSLLPSTGGIGTTIFYIVGAALIIVAVSALVIKRKNA